MVFKRWPFIVCSSWTEANVEDCYSLHRTQFFAEYSRRNEPYRHRELEETDLEWRRRAKNFEILFQTKDQIVVKLDRALLKHQQTFRIQIYKGERHGRSWEEEHASLTLKTALSDETNDGIVQRFMNRFSTYRRDYNCESYSTRRFYAEMFSWIKWSWIGWDPSETDRMVE